MTRAPAVTSAAASALQARTTSRADEPVGASTPDPFTKARMVDIEKKYRLLERAGSWPAARRGFSGNAATHHRHRRRIGIGQVNGGAERRRLAGRGVGGVHRHG